jgi:phage tail P2-like protein
MTTAADRLYDRLAPLATYDDENGGIVRALAETLALPQSNVDDVARDTDTQLAWQPLLDPDTCPAAWLPWLAQFPGVKLLPSDLTEAQQRARIKAAAGFYRGTTRAIVEAVQATLTGTQFVNVLNAVGGDPWAQTVITRTSETPDAAATTRAALSQKAAGAVQTVVVSNDPIWSEATLTWNTVGAAETWQTLAPGDV